MFINRKKTEEKKHTQIKLFMLWKISAQAAEFELPEYLNYIKNNIFISLQYLNFSTWCTNHKNKFADILQAERE